MTESYSEIPLVQDEENNERTLVLSNVYKVFQENSETQNNVLDKNQLYYIHSNQIKKNIFTKYIKFTKIYKWTDIKKCINKDNGFSEDIIHIINDCNLSNKEKEIPEKITRLLQLNQ